MIIIIASPLRIAASYALVFVAGALLTRQLRSRNPIRLSPTATSSSV